MSGATRHAFGAPGIAPTWSSSDKDYVTAALDGSRLWATIGHGIINEVYWPSTGQPQVRDLGFYLVGKERWIDLKRERRYRLLTPGPALPALNIAGFDGWQRVEDRLAEPGAFGMWSVVLTEQELAAAPSPGAGSPYLPGEIAGLGRPGRRRTL